MRYSNTDGMTVVVSEVVVKIIIEERLISL